ncbi:hypothetical protein MMC08_004623 [Hypocenomyce scalaris]|nr:hypothetical protein [Hypocenomyce scalaris]
MGKKNNYTGLVAGYAAVGSITYGYGAAIIAQTIGQPQFFAFFDLADTFDGDRVEGLMNGLFSLGGALGSLFSAWSSTNLGRLRSIQMACVICIIGALMTGAANLGMFLASRVIMGWGIGMMVCGVPLYQAELSTPKHRGFYVGLHGIALATGYALTGFVGFGCYYDTKTSFQWRFPFAVQLIPVIILLSGSWWLPESPRWLLSKGHRDRAWLIIQRLHADPEDPEDTFARKEFYQMDYQVTLYTQLGVTGGIPILLIAFWNVVGMIGNSTSALLLHDKFGRKRPFMVGIAGTAICLCFEAAMTKYYVKTNNLDPNNVGLGFGVFFVFFFVAFYACCMDGQQYVIVSETYPMEFRSIGTKGLSLEEINELFGDPVAVHLTDADKTQQEELEARMQNFDVHQEYAEKAAGE